MKFPRWRYILALGIVLVTGAVVWHVNTATAPSTNKLPAAILPAKQAKAVAGSYLFNGTIFWARRVQTWSVKADGTLDYNYPFSQLDTFDRQKYDAWVADLECPTTKTDVPMDQQENQLKFNCKPEYLPYAAKYFNIIDLANNHSDNMGPTGLTETRQALEANGIQHYGNYEPGNLGDTCEVISLPVRVSYSDNSIKKAGLPVAFCAWHYFYRKPLPGEIENMQKYAAVMPVFAFIHMGVEYKAKADPVQQEIAHKVADQGSEFVVANNPHWVQNSEVYKGKLIVYSTGNFIFDQQGDAEVTRSDSLRADVELNYDSNIQKWLDLAPQCAGFHDDCLAKAKALGLQKPKLSYKFSIVAGDNSNKITKKAGPDIQKAVEERLNWAATLQALRQN